MQLDAPVTRSGSGSDCLIEDGLGLGQLAGDDERRAQRGGELYPFRSIRREEPERPNGGAAGRGDVGNGAGPATRGREGRGGRGGEIRGAIVDGSELRAMLERLL